MDCRATSDDDFSCARIVAENAKQIPSVPKTPTHFLIVPAPNEHPTLLLRHSCIHVHGLPPNLQDLLLLTGRIEARTHEPTFLAISSVNYGQHLGNPLLEVARVFRRARSLAASRHVDRARMCKQVSVHHHVQLFWPSDARGNPTAALNRHISVHSQMVRIARLH